MTDTLTLCKGPVSLVHRSRSLSLYDPQDFAGGSAFWLGRNVTSDLPSEDGLVNGLLGILDSMEQDKSRDSGGGVGERLLEPLEYCSVTA